MALLPQLGAMNVRSLSRWTRTTLAFLGLVLIFLVLDWSAEYLWFETLGYVGVFLTIRLLKVGIFLGTLLPLLLYLWANLRVLRTATNLGTAARGVLSLIAFAMALIFALTLAAQWDAFLRYFWSQGYGETDPVYGHDISFYLFDLQLLELLQNGTVIFAFLTLLTVGLFYLDAGRLQFSWSRGVEAPPSVLRHLGANFALSLVALAWGLYLERFALLQSTTGAVYGAGYTDLYVVRPGLWIAMAATLGLAAAVLMPRLLGNWQVMRIAFGAYLSVMIVVLGVVPWTVQMVKVTPNELEVEEPFLRRSIDFTRKAYGLADVDQRAYRALDGLTLNDLEHNRQTIDNIRLWDWGPLSRTFRQLQQIRTYYEFGDVDVDRYRVGDRYRQVLLAARELAAKLPGQAETWVNRHLQYTHGYGLTMSLAAEKNAQGTPVLVIKDLPPISEPELAVLEPAIYYGENMFGHRLVATSVEEFDFPKGDDNVYTHYQGQGGVLLDSIWKKLLFSWHQFDARIALTAYTTPNSRIQLWRRLEDRVSRIAPFLELDSDPYLVLSDGRLQWIVDAYTVASSFPYSEPQHSRYNYIRNSVKVVVDAFEGSVSFHVIDPTDPVLRAYRAALPTLFRPLEEMSDELRRHLRYPQDLFAIQVAAYNTYHMTLPQVFYNREDLWDVPKEKYGGEQITMKPYYVLIKLPEEQRLGFLLMTPLTPNNRDNMIAWMAARSDFPGYGELLVYKLPKERLTMGPLQVEATIDQDPGISEKLSLWDQRGSRVVRGSLLVIPVEQSFLYVEPVYLIAEGTDIPQLKRVIVSDGEQVAMELTLEEALAKVFGGDLPAESLTVAAPYRRDEAKESLMKAEQALKEGDWEAFGRAMQELKGTVGE